MQRDPGEPFALVKAEPSAMLNKSRHILLVDMPQAVDLPPEEKPVQTEKLTPQQAGVDTPEGEGE